MGNGKSPLLSWDCQTQLPSGKTLKKMQAAWMRGESFAAFLADLWGASSVEPHGVGLTFPLCSSLVVRA